MLSDKDREKLETSVDDETVDAVDSTLVEDSDEEGENSIVEEVRKEVEKAVTVEDVPKKKRVVKKKPSAVSVE